VGGSAAGGVTSRGGTSTGGISTGTGGSTSTGHRVETAPLAPTDLNIAGAWQASLNVEERRPSDGVPNDPDGNEIQSAYQIQVTRVSDGVLIWDSGKIASSSQSSSPIPDCADRRHELHLDRSYVGPRWPGLSLGSDRSFDTGISDADWKASWIRRTTTETDDYTLARREVTIGASPVTRVVPTCPRITSTSCD